MNESLLKTRLRILEPTRGVRIYTFIPFPIDDPEASRLSTLLGKREQVDWQTRFRHPGRRNEWLAGRIAAKFALKNWFKGSEGDFIPADQLEILSDEQGAPYYAGPWKYDAERLPELSITHTDGLAAAVVHHIKKSLYPGIDLERKERRFSDRVLREVFTAEEEAAIASFSETDRWDWRLRLWCAREAAAKSLRRALVGSTHHFRADEIDFEAGTVYVAYGGLSRNNPTSNNKCTIPVKTWLHESYIMAVSLIQ